MALVIAQRKAVFLLSVKVNRMKMFSPLLVVAVVLASTALAEAPGRRGPGGPEGSGGVEGCERPQRARGEGQSDRRSGGPRRGGPGGPDGEHMPPPSPLFAAMDTNRDGELDSTELQRSVEAIMKLDRDGDGVITAQEAHGPGGPGGARGMDARRPLGPPDGEGRPGRGGRGFGGPGKGRPPAGGPRERGPRRGERGAGGRPELEEDE